MTEDKCAGALANLRHLYAQMLQPPWTSERVTRLARGLLGPAIADLERSAPATGAPRPTRYDCGEGVVLEWKPAFEVDAPWSRPEGWFFDWNSLTHAHGAHATVLARTCYPSPEAAFEALEKWPATRSTG